MSEGKSAEMKSSVAFSIDEAKTTDQKPRGSVKRNASKRGSLRSSFFRMRSMSFRRSGGDRGADLETLRGTNGPDFEGYAVISRAAAVGLVCCSCFGGGGDDTSEKILLIKGPYCFVFIKETDASPKYAIALAHMKAVTQPSSRGQFAVSIETSMGDSEWEVVFQQENIAKQFVECFNQQAAIGEADQVRKRLGHEKLLHKGTSVKYAEQVAEKKIGDQPEKNENAIMEELGRAQPMVDGF